MACHSEKEVEEFYRHPQMADGYLNKCKVCIREAVSLNRNSKIERYRGYDRSRNMTPKRVNARRAYLRTEAGRMARRHANENYILNHGAKRKAQCALNNAVRDGRVIKLSCEVCGDPKSEGHHEDYSKPLEVRWLCNKHHREEHAR